MRPGGRDPSSSARRPEPAKHVPLELCRVQVGGAFPPLSSKSGGTRLKIATFEVETQYLDPFQGTFNGLSCTRGRVGRCAGDLFELSENG